VGHAADRVPGNPLGNVLIIGAGTGDDVANALLKGARHIDAVEIDPRLHQLGRQLNPDHPYQDPRVSVHINDGRAFLERTHTKYDMILFALPDSLTLAPPGSGWPGSGQRDQREASSADKAPGRAGWRNS
jgi:spermidine synthase